MTRHAGPLTPAGVAWHIAATLPRTMPSDPHPALPPWISHAQFAVLVRLLEFFEERAIPYAATGGLAGNLHGSSWPLHDLDLDAPANALAEIASAFADHVVYGPAAHQDDEFALTLLTLHVDGVGVDVSAAESVQLRDRSGGVVPAPTDLQQVVTRPLADRRIRTIPLHQLIASKRVIGREADLAELERLARA